MEIAQPVDIVKNLVNLPVEIRCFIMQNFGFSIPDVQRISLSSTELLNNIRSCLRYLHIAPIHTINIAEEDYTTGGEIYHLQPGFIHLYPKLVESEYPITIASIQDLQVVAQHPTLRHVVLDMTSFYNSLLNQYLEEQEIAEEEGVDDWQFSGVNIDVMRRGALQTLTFTTVSGVLLFFLFEYRFFHPQHRLLGTRFIFILPNFEITYQPGSLCVVTQGGMLNSDIWDLDEIFREITRLDQIRRYAGPWPLPETTAFNVLNLYIDDQDIKYDRDDSSYILDEEMIVDILDSKPNLRRFGLYFKPNSGPVQEAFITFNFLEVLADRVFNNIQVLDYPVLITELPLLQRIFPNVKEPLLDAFIKLTPDEREILEISRSFFEIYRLLPGFNYPQELTNNFVTYVDPTNFFSQYPC